MHKPCGYLSQFKYNLKRKKKLLGELYDFPPGTMSIGRLDEMSEGLLLLTTDGKVSNYITGRKVEKEYHVQLDGMVTEEAVEQMRLGVEIGFAGQKYMTKPCEAMKFIDPPVFPPRSIRIRDERHGPTSWASVTIREGKYRQVRKMTAAVGYPTLRLIRTRIGSIRLGPLEPGKVIEVEGFDA